ncbi:MAG: phosphate propanoyltransferase [Oscillospiraceae bacterium]|jgi:putative phosphotransacetylase|nr:phosphate propanoyltransferase [Oscillospiraceae bacterium]
MELFEVVIEGSGRHIHVTREALDTLYGKGFELEPTKDLSQPNQFASKQKVDLVGPKGTIKNVSILGPCRPITQIELALTDARALGIAAPIRESGDIAGSAPLKIVGPNGELDVTEGAIIAQRHLHITTEDAAKYGITDKEIVQIKTSGERALIFDDVVARVGDKTKAATFVHIDYDEANAANGATKGIVVKKA